MKYLILILLITSCSVADKIEKSHNNFWESHKAVKVDSTKKKKHYNVYYCSHPLTDYTYKLKLYRDDTIFNINDTIKLNFKYRSRITFK